MYYVVDSQKTFDDVAADLEQAVKNNQFGVLHVHNLGATLRSKGMNFTEECKVFEVCSPSQAAKVLAVDLRLNMVLPCRISAYTEKGVTKLGFLKPSKILSPLSSDASLAAVADEVENSMINIVEAAK